MDLGLAGRVAFLSGSSRGIGYATARAFLEAGCRVAISGRDPESLTAAREALEGEFGAERLMALAGDLTEPDVIAAALAEVYEAWETIDCLVANVGSGRGTPGWAVDDQLWQDMFQVNLWGAVRLTRAVLTRMTAAGRGSIVLVASITGVEATPAPLPYSAAKSALINYGKNLSRAVGASGIRVNCVSPGNMLFEGGSWEKHLTNRREEIMQFIHSEVPLQRFGRPEEIADLIVFLSSDRASFITGANMVADGGQTRAM